MTWHKCDVRLQCSPRLRQVGARHGAAAQQRATLAYLAVLAVNAEHDCEGRLQAMYADPSYLGSFAPSLTPAHLLAALEQLHEAGLVSQEEAMVLLPGWDESWRAVKPSTARVRQHRRMKAERAAIERNGHHGGDNGRAE